MHGIGQCSVCNHPQRASIDACLVRGEPLRDVGKTYGLHKDALHRHKGKHINGALVQIAETREQYAAVRQAQVGLNIASLFAGWLDRGNRLLEACDEELRDPERPEKYFLGARSGEVSVLWEASEVGDDGKLKRVRRKERLEAILDRMRGEGMEPVSVEIRHHDIRRMILETQAECRATVEQLTTLMSKAFQLQAEHDAAAKLQAMNGDEARQQLAKLLATDCEMSEAAIKGLLARIEQAAARDAARVAELALGEEEE